MEDLICIIYISFGQLIWFAEERATTKGHKNSERMATESTTSSEREGARTRTRNFGVLPDSSSGRLSLPSHLPRLWGRSEGLEKARTRSRTSDHSAQWHWVHQLMIAQYPAISSTCFISATLFMRNPSFSHRLPVPLYLINTVLTGLYIASVIIIPCA